MVLCRAIALFVIVAFGAAVLAAGLMTSPASANKMDGKPGGGRNSAHYGPSKSSTPKPPPSTMKKSTAH